MHELTAETERLARELFERVLDRQRQNPMLLGEVGSAGALGEQLGGSITPDGLGGDEALRRWVEGVVPNVIAIDHPPEKRQVRGRRIGQHEHAKGALHDLHDERAAVVFRRVAGAGHDNRVEGVLAGAAERQLKVHGRQRSAVNGDFAARNRPAVRAQFDTDRFPGRYG